jgi:hypothetical protein
MQGRTRTLALLLSAGLLGTGMTLGTHAAKAEGASPAGYYVNGSGQEPWSEPPGEYRDEVARKGFHDGIEGARRDAENHRPPNVNNREEYRHPDVHGGDRRTYRDAFRRGYETGVQHLMNRDRDHDRDRDDHHY